MSDLSLRTIVPSLPTNMMTVHTTTLWSTNTNVISRTTWLLEMSMESKLIPFTLELVVELVTNRTTKQQASITIMQVVSSQ